MGQVLLLWLYQAWSADPTLRKTNLLPPGCDGGKDMAVIAGPSKENGQLALKRPDTPVALGTFFPGNGEGEDLSLPDLLFWLVGSEVTEWYLGVNLNLLVPISLESVYLPVVSS